MHVFLRLSFFQYRKLPQNEDSWSKSEQKHAAPPPKLVWAFLALNIAFLTAITYLLNIKPPATTSPTIFASIPDSIDCGQTVESALAAGCIFDELAHLWLPPICGQDLSDLNTAYLTYDSGKPFKYWADDKMVQEVDISLQPQGTIVYSIFKEHLAHCAFTLMRTSEWMRSGGKWEGKVLSPMHFDHCVWALFNATRYHPRWDELGTSAGLGFSGRCYSRIVM